MHATIVLAVAGAGAVGAACRYLMTIGLRGWLGENQWPIAVVNIVGCFGFGLCWGLAQDRLSHPVAIAVLAGFFGAFTTFSAFALDSHDLLVLRRYGAFFVNVMVQNGVGFLCLWLGIVAAGGRDGA